MNTKKINYKEIILNAIDLKDRLSEQDQIIMERLLSGFNKAMIMARDRKQLNNELLQTQGNLEVTNIKLNKIKQENSNLLIQHCKDVDKMNNLNDKNSQSERKCKKQSKILEMIKNEIDFEDENKERTIKEISKILSKLGK